MSTFQLHERDCREVIPRLPAHSIDVVIADPPYGDTSLEWDVPVTAWLPLLQRVLKPHGSLWMFGSLRMFMGMGGMLDGWRMAQDIVWEKHNGSGFHADRFKRVHEHVVQFYPADVAWSEVYRSPVMTDDATRRTMRRKIQTPHTGKIGASSYASVDGGPRLQRSVIRVRSCNGYAVHPTQKPEGIIEPLIEYSCPPGGTVLDPMAGSGTVLAVALAYERNAIGIEVDPLYCEQIRRRLHSIQSRLPFEEAI